MPSMFEELGTACLAPTPEAPLGYRKCGRCRGTGFYSHHVRRAHFGVPGLCLQCNGEGRFRISTPEEIATEKKARMAAVQRAGALDKIHLALADRDDVRAFALIAVNRLQAREPERYQRMLDSVEVGRVADVITHLVAYYHQTKRG